MSDDARRKWREARDAEQRARDELEDAARAAGDDPKAKRRALLERLADSATSSAVHAGVGVVVGFALAWLMRPRDP